MRFRHGGKKSRGDQHLNDARPPSRRTTSPREPVLPIVQLAKTVGNQAFSRLIQTRYLENEGSGHPLDHATKARMENAFGQDFSGVVIHTDTEAGAAARALDARAFAVGNHIVFDSGEYMPGSLLGDILIAHELAHVQQQHAAAYAGAAAAFDDPRLEAQANVAAVRAATSMPGGAKTSIGAFPRGAMPTLKASLQPQRCPVSAQRRSTPAYFGARSRATMDRLNEIAENGASLSNWITFGSVIVAFDDPMSALHSAEAAEALRAVPTIVRARMRQEVEFLLLDDATDHFLNDRERRFWEELDRTL